MKDVVEGQPPFVVDDGRSTPSTCGVELLCSVGMAISTTAVDGLCRRGVLCSTMGVEGIGGGSTLSPSTRVYVGGVDNSVPAVPCVCVVSTAVVAAISWIGHELGCTVRGKALGCCVVGLSARNLLVGLDV